MNIFSRSLLLIASAGFTLTACKDDDPVAGNTIAVTNVTITPSSNVEVAVGTSIQLSATVATNGGAGEADLTVTWSATPSTIASVNATTGVVTGVAAGNATVTATSNEDNTIKASVAVKVNAAPVAQNALTDLAVTPNNVSIVLGQTAATVTTPTTANANVTVTYANSSSTPSRCTVPATGANPTITTVVAGGTGTCVITVTATGTGTGLTQNQISRAVAVTVTAQPVALLSLTVTPNQVFLAPGGTQVLQTLTTSTPGANITFTNTTSNANVATVSGGANPTITAGATNGTAQITIRANGSGAAVQSNELTAIVEVSVQAASVSLHSVTMCTGGPPCVVTPVNLAGALGQLEATINIESGNQQISSVVVEMGNPIAGSCTNAGISWNEAASQIFGVNGAPDAPITLNINSAEFDANFVPKFLNGEICIRARIDPTSGSAPNASNTVKFTLVNPDVVYFNASVASTGGALGLNHTGNFAPQAGAPANIWWKGGFTYRAHPVLYSGVANVVSITYQSSACNGAGVAALPPAFAATFTCAGVQSIQNINNFVSITYVAGYTLTTSPTTFMTAASPGFVPGKPVYTAVNTREDNVGPVTATPVFNNPGSGGWHGNGSAGVNLPPVIPGTTYSVTATDGGVGGGTPNAGLASLPQINQINTCNPPHCSVVVPPSNNVTAANQLVETITPFPYQLRGTVVNDALGNVGTVAPASAAFGVDLQVLDANYANRPTSSSMGFVDIFTGANGTVYTGIASGFAPDWLFISEFTGSDSIAVDAIDTRSGLVPASALTQSIVRRAPSGVTNCLPMGTYAMSIVLSDNWVQSVGRQLDCGLAPFSRVGEYRWLGYVSDRAGNARKILRGGVPLDSIYIAIDEALPQIQSVGFPPSFYVGGQPATFRISATDDYELKDGQISLSYGNTALGGADLPAPIMYTTGVAELTPSSFSTPFDGVFANVLIGQPLTVGYYVIRYDWTTAAPFVAGAVPSGNVAGFGTSALNDSVTASVRDQANQPVATPVRTAVAQLQLQDRLAAPVYTAMIDFRITAKTGTPVVTVRESASTSITAPVCDRIDIYEAVNGFGAATVAAAGMLANNPALGDEAGDGLRWRQTISTPAVVSDNGFQRFFTYTSQSLALPPGFPVASGLFTAACVKGGSALLSPLF